MITSNQKTKTRNSTLPNTYFRALLPPNDCSALGQTSSNGVLLTLSPPVLMTTLPLIVPTPVTCPSWDCTSTWWAWDQTGKDKKGRSFQCSHFVQRTQMISLMSKGTVVLEQSYLLPVIQFKDAWGASTPLTPWLHNYTVSNFTWCITSKYPPWRSAASSCPFLFAPCRYRTPCP